jgi:hypothetical protein
MKFKSTIEAEEQLNKEKDNERFKPHNLPIHEYIIMPPFESKAFDEFRVYYIQNNGDKLEKYQDILNESIIYVVFKILEPHITYDFIPIEVFYQLNRL